MRMEAGLYAGSEVLYAHARVQVEPLAHGVSVGTLLSGLQYVRAVAGRILRWEVWGGRATGKGDRGMSCSQSRVMSDALSRELMAVMHEP